MNVWHEQVTYLWHGQTKNCVISQRRLLSRPRYRARTCRQRYTLPRPAVPAATHVLISHICIRSHALRPTRRHQPPRPLSPGRAPVCSRYFPRSCPQAASPTRPRRLRHLVKHARLPPDAHHKCNQHRQQHHSHSRGGGGGAARPGLRLEPWRARRPLVQRVTAVDEPEPRGHFEHVRAAQL
eukprot:scaffold4950_cov99-Isochrysis_galbana.AAC.7